MTFLGRALPYRRETNAFLHKCTALWTNYKAIALFFSYKRTVSGLKSCIASILNCVDHCSSDNLLLRICMIGRGLLMCILLHAGGVGSLWLWHNGPGHT